MHCIAHKIQHAWQLLFLLLSKDTAYIIII